MSPSIEQEIDRLYQLPLSEFTPARNALAKQPKVDRAAIGKLQKPSVPAWVINQLYWHRRGAYDAVLRASEQVRSAQAAMIEGRRADSAAAEAAHSAALKAATQHVRQLLSDAGEQASPATMTAVSETLQALPSSEPPGRLTRPLKPMGFEALTRLLAPGATKGSAATILPFASKAGAREAPRKAPGESPAEAARRERSDAKLREEAARREAQDRAREAKKLADALRDARTAERAAETAATRARAAAVAAKRAHHDLIRGVEEAENEVARLEKEAASKDRAVTEASVARQRLEARLKAID